MDLQMIALDRLEAHPRNSNVMPAALLDKLVERLRETDRYPPVIVRRVGGDGDKDEDGDEAGYQILDGHHRVVALRRLGRASARCVVWEVSDDEALLLLATLNRLQGQDDPRKRAALVDSLRGSFDVKALAARLPEDAHRIRKLEELHQRRPPPRPPQALGEMPVALHFFLLPGQRSAVERRLREYGGARERALLKLLGVAEAEAEAESEFESAVESEAEPRPGQLGEQTRS